MYRRVFRCRARFKFLARNPTSTSRKIYPPVSCLGILVASCSFGVQEAQHRAPEWSQDWMVQETPRTYTRIRAEGTRSRLKPATLGVPHRCKRRCLPSCFFKRAGVLSDDWGSLDGFPPPLL